MSKISDVAECIAALWKLGPGGNKSLWDAGGIIDQAIEDIYPQLPEQIQSQISFYDAVTGRRCREWQEVVAWMENARLVERDGSTFTRLRVCISSGLAAQFLFENGFSLEQRRDLPVSFFKAVQTREFEILQTL